MDEFVSDFDSNIKEMEIPSGNANPNVNKITQSQFYDIITNQDLSWQTIIFDLVRTEQLDPWDINIGVLADKYLQIIQQMEEANFNVSSKVLLACALLLRIKSEFLVNRDLPLLDEALYGKKEEKRPESIRIEIDDDDLPLLIPKTPMPRSRKVSLQELMNALNQAIETENRRIRKEIRVRQAQKATEIVMPNLNRIPLKDRIKAIYELVKAKLTQEILEIKYSDLAISREEKISSFLPVLHLHSDQKLHLHQAKHFEDILISTKRLRPDEVIHYSSKGENLREELMENPEEDEDETEEEKGFGKFKKKESKNLDEEL